MLRIGVAIGLSGLLKHLNCIYGMLTYMVRKKLTIFAIDQYIDNETTTWLFYYFITTPAKVTDWAGRLTAWEKVDLRYLINFTISFVWTSIFN